MTKSALTVVLLIFFFILYAFLQAFMYVLTSGSAHTWLHATSVQLAHVTGFAGMFGFAGLMEIYPVNGHILGMLCVVLLAAVVLAVLKSTSQKIDVKIAQMDGVIDEQEEEWLEECDEAKEDVTSICLSYNIVAVIRAVVRNEFQAYELHIEPHVSQSQCWILLACALLTLTLSLVLSKFKASPRMKLSSPLVQNSVKLYGATLGMTNAWLTLFWADWQLYALGYDDVRIAAFLIEALLLTAFAIASIFGLDFIADRIEEQSSTEHSGKFILRDEIATIGVMVGFAWERCFDIAIEDIAHSGSLVQVSPGITSSVIACLLLAVVLPAWHHYILPQALSPSEPKALKDEHGA